jgi:hypothetical protein
LQNLYANHTHFKSIHGDPDAEYGLWNRDKKIAEIGVNDTPYPASTSGRYYTRKLDARIRPAKFQGTETKKKYTR